VLSGRELTDAPGDIGTRELAYEAVAVSPDGRSVVAVHSKGGVVWMIPENKEQQRFEFARPRGWCCRRTASCFGHGGGQDGARLEDGDAKESLKLPSAGRALGFSPDNKHLATVAGDNIVVWEVETGKQALVRAGQARQGRGQGGRFDWSRTASGWRGTRTARSRWADAADGKVLPELERGAGAGGAVARWRPAGAGLRGRYGGWCGS